MDGAFGALDSPDLRVFELMICALKLQSSKKLLVLQLPHDGDQWHSDRGDEIKLEVTLSYRVYGCYESFLLLQAQYPVTYFHGSKALFLARSDKFLVSKRKSPLTVQTSVMRLVISHVDKCLLLGIYSIQGIGTTLGKVSPMNELERKLITPLDPPNKKHGAFVCTQDKPRNGVTTMDYIGIGSVDINEPKVAAIHLSSKALERKTTMTKVSQNRRPKLMVKPKDLKLLGCHMQHTYVAATRNPLSPLALIKLISKTIWPQLETQLVVICSHITPTFQFQSPLVAFTFLIIS
ncbi:hypothetical protein VNO77_30708 [Canavalia gladiata]|uniref:Uncharacterized protein n=1 Tax=Canavalia gladiata TaxID=3824 RepID=A0AAN9Q3P4_CANGL